MTGIQRTVHYPVLLKESIDSLDVCPNAWYIDGTFGFGGHSKEILSRGGKVLGIDQDKQTIEIAEKDFSESVKSGSVILKHANFRTLKEVTQTLKIKPEGVLLDLGYSSWQLDESSRGFSFLKDEPLDMRMDPQNQGVRARDLVNGLYEKELSKLIESYGEDPLARQIAKQIVKQRSLRHIETTFELASIIRDVYKHYYHSRSSKDPATKTFQALRIAVNDEINALKEGLRGAFEIVSAGGCVAVITFHGLEDRVVKKQFQAWIDSEQAKQSDKKPTLPSQNELIANPRSHSAKLRIIFKK